MTISAITVGTAATGVNASVTPGTPSGLVAGDFMLIVAAIRNAGVGTVNTPTGWTSMGAVDSLAMFGRFFQTGDVMPLITFAGGVANADTYARALKARGVAKDQLTESAANSTFNTSAQNISTPAYDLPGANHLLVMAAWKQDDATSLTTPSLPAAWTAQGLTNMTTGDDMLVGLFTLLETTEQDVLAGSVTVTGGVSAIGRSLILGIRPEPTFAATEVDLFPPRVTLSITGLTNGDMVQIYRVANGERVLIRGGTLASATDPSFVVIDGEVPYGLPVYYVAAVNTTAEYSTSPVTYDLPGGKPVLSDAITGDSSQFVIVAWDEKAYDRQASIFKAGGRNVVVAGDVGQFESTMQIFFEAWSSSQAFLALLSSATENVLQLRAPSSEYEGVDCYIAVVAAAERRFSQDGTDARRMWVLTVTQTDEWSEGLVATAFTYQDLADFYATASGTYATLASDQATYLSTAIADWSV